MAEELLQIIQLPLLLIEQNGHVHNTAHKTPQLLFHARFLLCYLHKLAVSTFNPSAPSPHYFLYFSNICFSASPLFCSLLPLTQGQTLPRMRILKLFTLSPSDAPFSDLVWLASPQRLVPWEHSVCYLPKRARLKHACQSYRIDWLFLHIPISPCILHWVSARKPLGMQNFYLLFIFMSY